MVFMPWNASAIVSIGKQTHVAKRATYSNNEAAELAVVKRGHGESVFFFFYNRCQVKINMDAA